jgi:hypothetical protein
MSKIFHSCFSFILQYFFISERMNYLVFNGQFKWVSVGDNVIQILLGIGTTCNIMYPGIRFIWAFLTWRIPGSHFGYMLFKWSLLKRKRDILVKERCFIFAYVISRFMFFHYDLCSLFFVWHVKKELFFVRFKITEIWWLLLNKFTGLPSGSKLVSTELLFF